MLSVSFSLNPVLWDFHSCITPEFVNGEWQPLSINSSWVDLNYINYCDLDFRITTEDANVELPYNVIYRDGDNEIFVVYGLNGTSPTQICVYYSNNDFSNPCNRTWKLGYDYQPIDTLDFGNGEKWDVYEQDASYQLSFVNVSNGKDYGYFYSYLSKDMTPTSSRLVSVYKDNLNDVKDIWITFTIGENDDPEREYFFGFGNNDSISNWITNGNSSNEVIGLYLTLNGSYKYNFYLSDGSTKYYIGLGDLSGTNYSEHKVVIAHLSKNDNTLTADVYITNKSFLVDGYDNLSLHRFTHVGEYEFGETLSGEVEVSIPEEYKFMFGSLSPNDMGMGMTHPFSVFDISGYNIIQEEQETLPTGYHFLGIDLQNDLDTVVMMFVMLMINLWILKLVLSVFGFDIKDVFFFLRK